MKKFLIMSAILFIVNMSCVKMDPDNGGLCACSPVTVPELYLVVKNSEGQDLLSNKTEGFYLKSEIELFAKDEKKKVIPIGFEVKSPFIYGEANANFDFSQLSIPVTAFWEKEASRIIYLKLGDSEPLELKVEFKKGVGVDKMFVNNIEIEKDKGAVVKYMPIFYFTKGEKKE